MTFAIILILVGVLFIIAEIVFLPGAIVGIVGAVFVLLAVLKIYLETGTQAGHIALGSTAALLAILFYIALRYKVWSRLALKDTIRSRVNEHLIDSLSVGDTGLCTSALRPVGKALFHDKEYEVQTLGNYLDQGSPVQIIQIKQLKIFVEPLAS